jgi:hypothetical protein
MRLLRTRAKDGGQRESLQVRTEFEAGLENVVAFLTEGITGHQLEMLPSLMDKKGAAPLRFIEALRGFCTFISPGAV